MQMPGRTYTANNNSYRYGFNGQEKSSELNSDGNLYTAEYWQYDSRIVRRWNVDPITKDDESPYLAFGGNPITLVDPNGADWYHKNGDKNKDNLTWFDGNGKHKDYKHDDRGTGFWTDRNSKGVSTYYGHGADDIQLDGGNLQDVVVTSRSHKATAVNWFHIPDYNKADVDRWTSYRAIVRDLKASGKPLDYAGAPQEYLDLLPNLERQWQANQDWRSTQYYMLDFATLFVPVPKVGMGRWLFGSQFGRVFWTGGGIGGKAATAAFEYAAETGGTTLATTNAGKIIIKITGNTENWLTGKIWDMGSWMYAKGAQGEVHTFVNFATSQPYMYSQTIGTWYRIELPVLTKNAVDVIYHMK